jgi:hypothetical protein
MLDTLAAWIVGSYNSMEQASSDTNYYYITLNSCLLDRRDSSFRLYMEQALGGAADNPFRQLVYEFSLTGNGNEYRSEVYTIPADSIYVGACSDTVLKAKLSDVPLSLRNGCDLVLRWNGVDAFEGGTAGKGCVSNLRRAIFSTSLLRVLSGGMESWDQGFDTAEVQVWGPQNGPYVFLREK